MSIGDIIKKIRKEKNISTYKLAKMTGVSQSVLSKLENGKRSKDLDLLEKIAAALEIDVTELMNYELLEHIEKQHNDPGYIKLLENQSEYAVYDENERNKYEESIASIAEKEKTKILNSFHYDSSNELDDPLTDDEVTAIKAFLETYRKMKKDNK